MSVTYKLYNEKLRIPEQELAEKLLMERKHFILGFEPGKGKSYPVIHCIQLVRTMKDYPIKVLIMSDATCIKAMWKAEMAPQGVFPKDTYFVTDRTAIGKVSDALLEMNWDIIIVDECQSLRSGITRAKSQYAKLVYQLSKRTEYVWGMTGTISGNNTLEPWCVLHNLNVAGMGNITTQQFKKHYCVMEMGYGPFGNFQKPTKLNTLGEKLMHKAYLDGVMFWPYDDNDHMPPMLMETKTFTVPLTTEYKNALDGILKLGGHESTTLKAIALQKAQQALNGFIYYEDEDVERQVYRIPNYKNPKLEYVINECKSKMAIIAYRFQEDGTDIENALTEANISWTGDIQTFKQGNHKALVLQCSKGKAANIQICQNIIYYTSDFSFIAYKQFIHRTWRRGQTEACTVTYLVNDPGDKHQVEQNIFKSLSAKQSVHDMLMSIKQPR